MTPSDSTIDIGIPERKKVLVAEDEPSIASLIEDWLSDEYEIIPAQNGKAALEKARWHQPSMILMDVMMPDMGGYEAARALQGEPLTKGIPVVVMSAKDFDKTTIGFIKNESNVVGFLRKPFQAEDLRSAVKKAIVNRI
ncbi:MAG: response regulator [Elusimicrobia bacterium]|nr:response regulator [Elusimicrobiota bacterium]